MFKSFFGSVIGESGECGCAALYGGEVEVRSM
jgi:hypothetical protein